MTRIFDITLNSAVLAWLAVLGFILGVVGIAYAVISNRRNKRVKEPCWAVQSYELVIATVPDLEVSFQGRRVATVTISEVLFWNYGRETINGTDTAAANPLRIVPDNSAEILTASVVAANSLSQPSIVPSKQQAVIGFDFLDQGQGVIFRVLHTGILSQVPQLLGDVRGAEPLRRIDYRRDLMYPPPEPPTGKAAAMHFLRIYWSDGLLLAIAVIATAAVFALAPDDAFAWGVAVIFWLVTLIVVGYDLWSLRGRPPRQPTGFLPIEEPPAELAPNLAPNAARTVAATGASRATRRRRRSDRTESHDLTPPSNASPQPADEVSV